MGPTSPSSPRVPWSSKLSEAAQTLAARGVQATVVNCRFLKPHDGEVLQEVVEGHGKVLTIEEGAVLNGFGACMTREIDNLDSGHDVQVRCLGLPDRFVEHGTRDSLLRDVGLDVEGIVTEARRMLGDAVSSAAETAVTDEVSRADPGNEAPAHRRTRALCT